MSELQLSLIVIGALVVAGVLVFNRMQERSVQKRTDQAFRSGHTDALMGSAREEAPLRAAEAPGRASERAAGSHDHAVPDSRLDYVMEMRAAAAVSAASVLELWPGLARRFRDRALIAGSVDGQHWMPVGEGDAASYVSLRAGLQLVSRAGVVGEAELIEFRSEVENLASRLGLHAVSPEMKTALDAARALDAFCADRDIQVALHVVARDGGGFDRQALLALGERFGLTIGRDGHLACRDSGDRLVYIVADRSGARLDASGPVVVPLLALSLTMDVPRAPDTGRSFESMARLAGSIAHELGGSMVDDNGNVLDERSLAAIGAQLEAARGELDSLGFAPGGPLALRLFS